MRVILASESPNKRELLEHAGIDFEVLHSEYEEDMTLEMPLDQLAVHHALGKARAIAEKNPEAIIIATDVFVEFEGKAMCKAKDEADARRMLNRYPGEELKVICGTAVVKGSEEESFVELAYTRIREDLSREEIDGYIKTGEPMEASGPFKMSRLGVNLIERTRGEHSTIVGLPLYPVLKILRKHGVNPLCQQ